MPGFNKTGPMGQGPKTGWGMGGCNPSSTDKSQPSFQTGFGRRFSNRQGCGNGLRARNGQGFGRGMRGAGRMAAFDSAAVPRDSSENALNDQNDINALREQAEQLKQTLSSVTEKIQELEKEV